MPEMLSPHHLPKVFDAAWVFADDQFRQIFDRADDASRVPLERRFAPAEQSRLIGDDFDKHPVSHPRMTHDGFDGGNFHA